MLEGAWVIGLAISDEDCSKLQSLNEKHPGGADQEMRSAR